MFGVRATSSSPPPASACQPESDQPKSAPRQRARPEAASTAEQQKLKSSEDSERTVSEDGQDVRLRRSGARRRGDEQQGDDGHV